jgi:betaine-aldehyde dehydrogenase
VRQVTPWNYPMMMAVWKFAPALAAGNTVVLKPSDTTPVSTLLMAEIAAEFLPPGVFNVICGNADTGRSLVSHDIPQMVSITGSVRAGTEVARAAADGSSGPPGTRRQGAGRVFDDADVATAAAGVARPGTSTPGRTAPRPPGCWPARHR